MLHVSWPHFYLKKEIIMKVNIKEFIGQYYNKTFVDRRFQRRVVWNNHNRVNYLNSLLQDRAYSPIMLVDIRACLGACTQEIDNDTSHGEEFKKELLGSKEYFERRLESGAYYLSLDGQNRAETIDGVIKNTVNLQGVSFSMGSGYKEIIFKKERQYANLEGSAKNYIDLLPCVNVVIISNLPTLQGIRAAFVSENDGMPLTVMEKISPIVSPIGDKVHYFSGIYEETFQNLDNRVCKWQRKEDQDWITKLMKIVCKGIETNTKVASHMQFWKDGKKLTKREEKLVKNVLDDLQTIVEDQIYMRATWKLWSVLCALYWYHSQYSTEYVMRNRHAFAEYIIDHVEKLRAQADQDFGRAMTTWHNNKKIGEKPASSQYFTHANGNSDVGTSRKKWTDIAFTEELAIVLFDQDIFQEKTDSASLTSAEEYGQRCRSF